MDLIEYKPPQKQLAIDVSNLPDNIDIPPKYNNYTKYPYNKSLIGSIIYTIASDTTRTIRQICLDFNYTSEALFLYISVSNELSSIYHAARATRASAMVEDTQSKGVEIGKTIENIDVTGDYTQEEIRKMEALTRWHRVHSLNAQYEASRLNKYYKDKSEITHDLGAGVSRARAWDDWSKAKEIPLQENT